MSGPRYQALTLAGVPNWRACDHDGMVETGRLSYATGMVQQFWCPSCGARRSTVTHG